MGLINGKKKALYNLLVGNLDNTEYLFSLEPKEVVCILQKKGYDYTEEELIEFVKELKQKIEGTSEFDASTLDDITGGTCNESTNSCVTILTLRIRDMLEKCVWKYAV